MPGIKRVSNQMLSVKLRLVDWRKLNALAFSSLCGKAVVFFVHKIMKDGSKVAL